ncbi:Hypothetical protein A7982_02319 [Minicystis rosea]|nr:Hypothetical protein A7982_02319 [Minicystis rosea]
MLVIREAQMEILRRAKLEPFHAKLVAHARAALRDRTEAIPAPMLAERIWAAMEKAWSHRITTEAGVARFLEYDLCYGPHLDVDPAYEWVGPILRAPVIGESEKLAKLDMLDARLGARSRAAIILANLQRLSGAR